MLQAVFRFYAELNDFLPPAQRYQDIHHTFKGPASVKDRIESLGPPHPEVELILVNGAAVGFDYLVQQGDRIAVYPRFHNLPVEGPPLRPPPPQPARFILDAHLGKLARLLRMLGFDASYHNDIDDDVLVQQAQAEDRILLTRDRGVLKYSQVVHGYCLRSLAPSAQLIEVLHRYELADEIEPFQRCMACNGVLVPVSKAAILHLLEPKTKLYYNEFRRCQECGQIYWKGSHFERMEKLVERYRRLERPPKTDDTDA